MSAHTDLQSVLDTLVQDPDVPAWGKLLINALCNTAKDQHETASIVQMAEKTKTELECLKKSNVRLQNEMALLLDELDAIEQFTRRNSLIFHGLYEQKGESTNTNILEIIHNQLRIPANRVSSCDIDYSYRLGREEQNATKPRPIVVKFKGFDVRNEVFQSKRNLKNSNVLITENLTKRRYGLLRKCVEKFGEGNIWTNDGRITTKIDQKFVIINNENDLVKLTEQQIV